MSDAAKALLEKIEGDFREVDLVDYVSGGADEHGELHPGRADPLAVSGRSNASGVRLLVTAAKSCGTLCYVRE